MSTLICLDIDCKECKHIKKDGNCSKGRKQTTINTDTSKWSHFRCNFFERKLKYRLKRLLHRQGEYVCISFK